MDIELIHANNRHVHELLKNQTSVIEAQYNLLQRTEDLIAKQHKTINRHLMSLDKAATSMNKQLTSIISFEDFTMTTISTIQMLSNLRRIQDTLLNTLTDLNHGKFNLHLMAPEQLKLELQIITSQLSQELTLPFIDGESYYQDIYKLLTVKSRIMRDYFIFEIKFPLVRRDIFKLYKLVPIPYSYNNQMVTIVTNSEYVAINLRKDAFIETNSNEIQGCIPYKKQLLCKMHRPIKNLRADEKFCVLQDTVHCKIKLDTCKDHWYELTDSSTHLYFYCNKSKLRIICDENMNTIEMHNSGLIKFNNNCVAKGHDFTYHAQKHDKNIIYVNANLPVLKIAPINNIFNLSLPYINNTNIDFNDTLSEIKNNIRQLKEQNFDDEGQMSIHDYHQYAVSYAAVAGVAALSTLLVTLWYRRRRGRMETSSTRDNVPQCQGSGEGDKTRKQSIRVNTATSPIVTKRVYIHTDDETIL
ncbi:unnamed protein product [Colias eurytheme]|nr:unnamed protein product [Colias eurytheme]